MISDVINLLFSLFSILMLYELEDGFMIMVKSVTISLENLKFMRGKNKDYISQHFYMFF